MTQPIHVALGALALMVSLGSCKRERATQTATKDLSGAGQQGRDPDGPQPGETSQASAPCGVGTCFQLSPEEAALSSVIDAWEGVLADAIDSSAGAGGELDPAQGGERPQFALADDTQDTSDLIRELSTSGPEGALKMEKDALSRIDAEVQKIRQVAPQTDLKLMSCSRQVQFYGAYISNAPRQRLDERYWQNTRRKSTVNTFYTLVNETTVKEFGCRKFFKKDVADQFFLAEGLDARNSGVSGSSNIWFRQEGGKQYVKSAFRYGSDCACVAQPVTKSVHDFSIPNNDGAVPTSYFTRLFGLDFYYYMLHRETLAGYEVKEARLDRKDYFSAVRACKVGSAAGDGLPTKADLDQYGDQVNDMLNNSGFTRKTDGIWIARDGLDPSWGPGYAYRLQANGANPAAYPKGGIDGNFTDELHVVCRDYK